MTYVRSTNEMHLPIIEKLIAQRIFTIQTKNINYEVLNSLLKEIEEIPDIDPHSFIYLRSELNWWQLVLPQFKRLNSDRDPLQDLEQINDVEAFMDDLPDIDTMMELFEDDELIEEAHKQLEERIQSALSDIPHLLKVTKNSQLSKSLALWYPLSEDHFSSSSANDQQNPQLIEAEIASQKQQIQDALKDPNFFLKSLNAIYGKSFTTEQLRQVAESITMIKITPYGAGQHKIAYKIEIVHTLPDFKEFQFPMILKVKRKNGQIKEKEIQYSQLLSTKNYPIFGMRHSTGMWLEQLVEGKTGHQILNSLSNNPNKIRQIWPHLAEISVKTFFHLFYDDLDMMAYMPDTHLGNLIFTKTTTETEVTIADIGAIPQFDYTPPPGTPIDIGKTQTLLQAETLQSLLDNNSVKIFDMVYYIYLGAIQSTQAQIQNLDGDRVLKDIISIKNVIDWIMEDISDPLIQFLFVTAINDGALHLIFETESKLNDLKGKPGLQFYKQHQRKRLDEYQEVQIIATQYLLQLSNKLNLSDTNDPLEINLKWLGTFKTTHRNFQQMIDFIFDRFGFTELIQLVEAEYTIESSA